MPKLVTQIRKHKSVRLVSNLGTPVTGVGNEQVYAFLFGYRQLKLWNKVM